MSNKNIQKRCPTCQYRRRQVVKRPCARCTDDLNHRLGLTGWRRRSWWKLPVMIYILLVVIAAMAFCAMALIAGTTARAADSSPILSEAGQGWSRDTVDSPQPAALTTPLSEGRLMARQEEVHAAAELLRELGVSEDSDGIKALQEEWWRCQARLYPRYTEEEVVMLAKLMWGEARSIESKTEVACVGWTVCNRVDDQPEPVTVRYVITVPNRFCYSESFPVREDLLGLARDVLERWTMESLGCPCAGRVLPSDYRWFVGRDGHNRFRNAYKGGEQWDYALPSPYES